MRRLVVLALVAGCSDPAVCEDERLPFRSELHCAAELEAEAARPLDAALPGAITVKTIVDRASDDALTFQDTEAYPVHSRFAIEHLGWPPGQPFADQYLSPGRRFLLGSVTYYEEPGVFAYELAPYDTATPEMIEAAFHAIAEAAYFGGELRFHPTSEEQAALAVDVPTISTDELFAGISYQPLNLGETYAQVHVLTADQLATTYAGPREIAVLDRVPNDLSVVAAVVTAELQTPLSHVNVLSQQRGTPNMALRGAHERFAPLDGRWVRLTVRAFDWEVEEVSADDAEAWWQTHRPPPAQIPAPDYSVTQILDVDDVGLGDVGAVGGKAANYGVLRDLDDADLHVRDAVVVPVSFYRDFLVGNGFDTRIAAMLADPEFRADGNVRREMLAALQADMRAAPVDTSALEARLTPGVRMKLRSSTNAEDLERHSAAGLYDSAAGPPFDDAIRTVYASVWNARAFEEREYAGIDHTQVAMAVLVTPSFTDEAANGVAITGNIFDPDEDGFNVNAQVGETSVVQPDPGVVADSLLYYWYHPNQPATYYTRSTLGSPVLTRAQLFALGAALDAVRTGFAGELMDVEWKLVGDEIWIKQARPYPGRGSP